MNQYDDNQLRAYPLVGHDDYRIPHDILVDLVVQAPDSMTGPAQVMSLSVTPMVVSILVGIAGQIVASLTMAQDGVESGVPYDLTPQLQGVSGFVAFGAGVKTSQLRVDGPVDLVPQAFIPYRADPTGATVIALDRPFQGLVKLSVGTGLGVEVKPLRLYNPTLSSIQVVQAVVISATAQSVLEDPVSACWQRADGVLGRTPLRSVAGVPPTVDGRLTINAIEVLQTSDAPAIIAQARSDGIKLVDSGLMCQGVAS